MVRQPAVHGTESRLPELYPGDPDDLGLGLDVAQLEYLPLSGMI